MAEQRLTKVELGYSIIGKEYSSEIAANYVLKQDINAGTVVQINTVLNITVSGGELVDYTQTDEEGRLSLADVQYRSKEEAVELLELQGMIVTITEEYSDTVASGVVIRQTPEAGTSVTTGTNVTLAVSLGRIDAIATQTPTESPTTIIPIATQTPIMTDTPTPLQPIFDTVQPTPSPSPTPTAKPSPSPSPTPTAKPSPSPTPTPKVIPGEIITLFSDLEAAIISDNDSRIIKLVGEIVSKKLFDTYAIIKLNDIIGERFGLLDYLGWSTKGTGKHVSIHYWENGDVMITYFGLINYNITGTYSCKYYRNGVFESHIYGNIINGKLEAPYYLDTTYDTLVITDEAAPYETISGDVMKAILTRQQEGTENGYVRAR